MTPTRQTAFLQQAYAAVGQPARWDGLIAHLAGALDAQSGLLFSPDDQFMLQPQHAHAYDFDMARAYGEYYHQHDVWSASARQQRRYQPGEAACGESLVSRSALRQSLFYNDFLRPMGQESVLCAVLFSAGNALGVPPTVLSFYRPPGRRGFGRAATAALQATLPHLQHCLALHHELLRARAAPALFASGLDQVGAGVLLFGSDGQLQFANHRAEALLQCTPHCPGLLARLHHLAGQARQGLYTGQRLRTPQGMLYAIATPQRPHQHVYNHATHAPNLQAAPLPVRSGAVIWLMDLGRHSGGQMAAAATLFGLTPAEQKVLGLLMDDLPPKAIAQQLDVALSTVRSQLSAILHKTGVRRQQELLRLMAAFPVPGADPLPPKLSFT